LGQGRVPDARHGPHVRQDQVHELAGRRAEPERAERAARLPARRYRRPQVPERLPRRDRSRTQRPAAEGALDFVASIFGLCGAGLSGPPFFLYVVFAFRRTTLPRSCSASLAANTDNPRRNCGPSVHTLSLPRRSIAGFSDIHTWHAQPLLFRPPRITLR